MISGLLGAVKTTDCFAALTRLFLILFIKMNAMVCLLPAQYVATRCPYVPRDFSNMG